MNYRKLTNREKLRLFGKPNLDIYVSDLTLINKFWRVYYKLFSKKMNDIKWVELFEPDYFVKNESEYILKSELDIMRGDLKWEKEKVFWIDTL